MKLLVLVTEINNSELTTLFPLIISAAIHPSVPVIPDFLENDAFPTFTFLHSPKSDISALTRFLLSGKEINTL